MQIVWLGRIGRHVVTVAGPEAVDRPEAVRLFQGWKGARGGERRQVGAFSVKAWRAVKAA